MCKPVLHLQPELPLCHPVDTRVGTGADVHEEDPNVIGDVRWACVIPTREIHRDPSADEGDSYRRPKQDEGAGHGQQ